MEEILASIRRIIADDDANKAAKPAPTAAAKPAAAAAIASDLAAPAPSVPPSPPPRAMAATEDEIEAMLANLDTPAAPPLPSDVLDLTEEMAAPAPAAEPAAEPRFHTIDASSDVVFSDRPAEAPVEPPPRMIEEPRRANPQTAALDRGLISSTTMAAVDSAFNTLAYTVIGQNARTLEDLVKEMLRPMLKSWLDDNLPGLVDRIVRAEIERVSRGR
jgi:cell pole-organizing protein PopZ